MRSPHCVLIIAGGLLLAAGCNQGRGSASPPPAGDAQQASANALVTLRKLVTEQNYKGLGFQSADEVTGATLGQPLTQYNIGLDRLKSYEPGADASALLSASSETIYPVTVGGQVRSSVTVVKRENGYTTASFGNAAIVKALTRYRESNTPNGFVVRIPVFGMYFLGNRIENRLLLTPVYEDSRVPLRTGEAVPAEEVLKVIVPLAREYNGLPM